jgi:hypothetical protein
MVCGASLAQPLGKVVVLIGGDSWKGFAFILTDVVRLAFCAGMTCFILGIRRAKQKESASRDKLAAELATLDSAAQQKALADIHPSERREILRKLRSL